ncbi:DUF5039 family protein [Bacteroides reticulotermitis]|uniref:DUF5039 family protein n=1 Tax=Bacteroides reticulotermitis TaxID=1133319 RepID=UPI003A8BF115
MKTTKLFFLLSICFLSSSTVFKASAQTLEQLDNSLQEINKDLQQKQLSHSWLLMEDYLDFCERSGKTISIKSEDYLKVLTYERKPKELKPQENAYLKAKEILEKHMRQYPDYAKADEQRRIARSEIERKNASAALSAVYSRLWNDDKKYQKLRNNEQIALRAYRIATVRYMLKEHEEAQRVMPSGIIGYADKKTLQENNVELRKLSLEISLLQQLQNETLRKYQRIKYQLK